MPYLTHRLKPQFLLNQQAGWLPYLLLILWQGLLLAASTVETSLMAHDEGWYTTLALGLTRSGEWLSPRWWGSLTYDKTSGVHWMIATAFSVFGISEPAARVPSGLSSLICISLTYAIGSILLHRRAAFLGALCISTVIIWTQYGQLATQDMPLIAVELAAIWALLQAERHPRHRWFWGGLAGSALGLAFFVKGFMAALPAVALLPYLVFNHRDHRHLSNPGLYAGLVAGVGLVGYWFWQLWQTHGQEPFNQLFGILILAAAADYHGVGPWYYLWNIPANFLPWTPLAIWGCIGILRSPQNRRRFLTLGYPATLMLLLQLFTTKTIYYPLQIYPFLGLYSGYALSTVLDNWSMSSKAPAAAKGASLFYGTVACLALVFLVGLWHDTWLNLGWIDDNLQQALYAYGLPAMAVVVCWLIHGASGLGGLAQRSQPSLWVASVLLGPWLAIGLAGVSGLIGNYSADVKAFCQQPAVHNVLVNHTVDLVLPEKLNRADHETWVLITFCSAQWGDRLSGLENLEPDRYAWVSLPVASALDDASGSGHTTLGTIRGWALIQRLP